MSNGVALTQRLGAGFIGTFAFAGAIIIDARQLGAVTHVGVALRRDS